MWSYMMNGGWYAWGLAGMLLHMVLWGAFIVKDAGGPKQAAPVSFVP